MDEIKRDSEKVKSIFYFAISPEFRHHGVALVLLKTVLQDAKNDGFDYIEVYQNTQFVDIE